LELDAFQKQAKSNEKFVAEKLQLEIDKLMNDKKKSERAVCLQI
jgi:hypothetical protein